MMEYRWSTPRLQMELINSGESLCIIEATSSVVLNWSGGVALAAERRLIILSPTCESDGHLRPPGRTKPSGGGTTILRARSSEAIRDAEAVSERAISVNICRFLFQY